MSDTQSYDLDLIEVFQAIYRKKIFISIFTATFFILASSIYLLATVSIDKSYNLAVTVEKKNDLSFDKTFDDINISSFINIENLDEAIEASNLNLDLDTNEILGRISIVPGGARLSSISKKIMNQSGEKILKKLLIDSTEFNNLISSVHGHFDHFYDFTYRSDLKTQLSDSNALKLLNNMILVINSKMSNYLSTFNDNALVKKINIYEWDDIKDSKNYEIQNSQTKAQLIHYQIIQNEEYIESLSESFSTYVRSVNLDNLMNTNKLIKSEMNLLIEENNFLVDKIKVNFNSKINELTAKVKILDSILYTISNNTVRNFNDVDFANIKTTQNVFNDGVLNKFLDMGNQVNFVEFKLKLLLQKKELLFQVEDLKNELISIGVGDPSSAKLDNSVLIDFTYINYMLERIGNHSVDTSNKINEYIDLTQNKILGKNMLLAVNTHTYDKNSKISKGDLITIILIFIVSFIFTLLLSLAYKREN